MAKNVVVLLDNPEGKALIKQECLSHNVSFPEFSELVQAEVDQTGKQRKRGLFDTFDDILDRIEIGE
ncbi:hypothetical protein CPT32_28340 [Rhizobium sophoriradicis]|uniref:hypothetical protein n=1 Tax=Rhizobium sophoriradicis TaxID=1535245 RepID=UPI000BBD7A1B|nr:hypothetical protein [Rhizobium sophoriradicis]PCK83633.1 hypothetical protein CPT32_28340 [Rhizobium sophoriradicis]